MPNNTKTPQENPDPVQLPGEVERDNDALRPNEPGKGPRDSTAQSAAKEAIHKQKKPQGH